MYAYAIPQGAPFNAGQYVIDPDSWRFIVSDSIEAMKKYTLLSDRFEIVTYHGYTDQHHVTHLETYAARHMYSNPYSPAN